MLLICPIEKGWSVIGRSDKYLSPVAITSVEYLEKSITLTLHESGPLVVYSAVGIPQMDDKKGEHIGNNLYLFDLPIGEENVQKVIRR